MSERDENAKIIKGTGMYEPGVLDVYLPEHQVLYPVEVDTQDEPNPLADALPGYELTIDLGTSKWRLAVVRTEHLSGNRWRAWCERPVELDD